VIAKAWESGGRKRVEGPTLMALLDAVLDAVPVPVIAAGGIATARGVAAALAAGADGVPVGTRFIAATESEAHPAWVRAVLDASAEEAVVSEAFNVGLPEPGPHRVLRSSIEAAEALTTDEAGVVRLAGAEIPVPRFGGAATHARINRRGRGDAVLRRTVGGCGGRNRARRRDRPRPRERAALTRSSQPRERP
jgi:NAD(P)H-dependent flavin oxidoreductase YrpB (nitropropane dioxygenase family)